MSHVDRVVNEDLAEACAIPCNDSRAQDRLCHFLYCDGFDKEYSQHSTRYIVKRDWGEQGEQRKGDAFHGRCTDH